MYCPMESAFRKFLRDNSYEVPRNEHDKWDKFLRFESTYNDLLEIWESAYDAGKASRLKDTGGDGMTSGEFVAIFADSMGSE